MTPFATQVTITVTTDHSCISWPHSSRLIFSDKQPFSVLCALADSHVAVLPTTTQCNTTKSFITHACRMLSRSAESEARACCKEENGEAGLREGTGEITCIKVPLKRGKPAYMPNLYSGFVFCKKKNRNAKNMASAGARAYMGVWGRCPQRGPGAEPLVKG